MKHLALLTALIFSFNCFSQEPNPHLFQNWYLISVQGSDMSDLFNVLDMQPQIAPTLIINENLSFTGTGACNTFTGTFNGSDYELETIQFSSSAQDCGVQMHNSFEDTYFGFMQGGGWYSITTLGDGLKLIINTPIFGQAIFQNFMLKTADFVSNTLEIYPNPSSSQIVIAHNNLGISEIDVFGSLGQKVKSLNENFESIDISDLPVGIYLLKIKTDSGIINKRIIKD